MIHINLLPVRQLRLRLQVRNEVAIYLASILILSVAIFLVAELIFTRATTTSCES